MPMTLIDALLWIPMLSLLAYIPLVCWLDYKYREIDHYWWFSLALINIPLSGFLYFTGIYDWYLLIPSVIASVIFFIAMRFHYIEGADFMYSLWIFLFFVYNPISQHILMPVSFIIYFIACIVITGMGRALWNFIHGKGLPPLLPTREDRFPMMFPLSFALILTAVLA